MAIKKHFCARMVSLACTVSFCLMPKVVSANPLEPVTGARSVSMGGAHRGLGTSNDTLILNPAGMAALRRYSVDVVYDLRGDHISRLMVSAVDSKTGPIAAGVAYTREWGNPSGYDIGINRFLVGMAFQPLQFVSIGLTANNVKGGFVFEDGHQTVNNFNASAGLMLSLAQLISVGVTYDNFIHKDAHGLLPPALAFGGSIKTRYLGVAGDMRLDRRSAQKNTKTYNAGAEVFLGPMFVVRGGWRLGYPSPSLNGSLKQYVSAGLATYAAGGGIETGFEKALGDKAWRFIVALQFGM